MSRSRRTSVLLTSALVAAVSVGAPAAAAALARATAPQTATALSWGAQAGRVGQPPGGGNYVVLFNFGNPVPPQFFSVTNTGSGALTGQTYTAVNSKPSSGNAPPEVALDACVGAVWNATLNVCTGTVVRLTTSRSATGTAASVALARGAVLSVRAAPITLANFPQEFQTTVTVAVSRAQAGAAATTSS